MFELSPEMLFVLGGTALSGLAVAVYFLFFHRTEENGDFEKVYNSNALAILTEVEKKDKKGVEKEKAKKNKKKKEEKKAEKPAEKPEKVEKVEKPVEIEEKVEKIEKIPEKTEKVAKKKAPKPINIKELDQKKLISRLSTIPDLEEGYIQFLTGLLRDADLHKNNLGLEVKALHKKVAEAAAKVEKANKEKVLVEQREKSELTKQAALTAKLQARESELAHSIQSAQNAQNAHSKELQTVRTRSQQLEAEIQHLKAANLKLEKVQKAAPAPVAPAPVQNAAENAKLREKIAQLNAQIQKFEAHHEKKIGEYLALSHDAAAMEKTIAQLETALAGSRHELVAQTERETKKDVITRGLEDDKKRMTEEYHKLKALVDGLNKDVDEFHEYKKEQEVLVDEMKKREVLREQQLSAIQKELEAEKSSKIVEIPLNSSKPAEIEEVFELKKTSAELESSPSTSGNFEAENQKLREKNEELRQRNYNLLEKTEKNEKNEKILEERKLVVEILAHGAKKTDFKQLDDENAYIAWIQQTVANSSQRKPEVTKPKKLEVNNEGECRKALKTLLTQLETIGRLAEQQEDELRTLRA